MNLDKWKSQIARGTLEYCILLMLEKKTRYGYEILQELDRYPMLASTESTVYPLLRRLQKDECLETYDQAFAGRNRRYYKITEKGMAQLNLYRVEWRNYSTKISKLFEGGIEL